MFRYYLIVMFGSMAALVALATGVGHFPFGLALAGVVGCTAVVFALDAVIAALVRCYPAEKIDPFRGIWRVSRREKRFLVRLGVRKFKDYIPETGGLLCDFQKSHVIDITDNVYLLKFLRETCYAECMHAISIFAGFAVLIIHIWLPMWMWWFALPVACVNAVLQLLPVLVQRYVRPLMTSAYLHNEKRAKKAHM